jgi:thiamine pyrophosphokinase
MNVLFVLAGEPPSSNLLRASLDVADLSIGIDGGLTSFQINGLIPDIHIGDLDSSQAISESSFKSIRITDQETTDLEKALDYVIDNYKPTHITILGATGGRTDHLVNNLQILSTINNDINITLKHDGSPQSNFELETLFRITARSHKLIPAVKGSILSIIYVSEFDGLQTEGLKWDIQNGNSTTQFISQSNIILHDNPTIKIDSGCVYVTVYQ